MANCAKTLLLVCTLLTMPACSDNTTANDAAPKDCPKAKLAGGEPCAGFAEGAQCTWVHERCNTSASYVVNWDCRCKAGAWQCSPDCLDCCRSVPDTGADMPKPKDTGGDSLLVDAAKDSAAKDSAARDSAAKDSAAKDAGDSDALAANGEICGGATGRQCKSGLKCCYPCGIAGCDFRCRVPCTLGPGCANGCPLLP